MFEITVQIGRYSYRTGRTTWRVNANGTNRQQIEPAAVMIADWLDQMERQERFDGEHHVAAECIASWRQRLAKRVRELEAKHHERVERATKELPQRCSDPRMKSAFERATRAIERVHEKTKVPVRC